MNQNARFRINLSTRELEVEGSEEFVREYAERFENVISTFTNEKNFKFTTSTPYVTDEAKSQNQEGFHEMPEIFGEFFQKFSKEISDIDKVLVAAYFAQKQDEENVFTTAIANNHLKSMGIKVANASRARGVKYLIGMKKDSIIAAGVKTFSKEDLEKEKY